MGPNELVLWGEFASHPVARPFATEVRRVHGRYADEVVAAYQLCPFMRDAETGFGRFYVLLDREPDLQSTLRAAQTSDNPVVHLVFPCIRTPSSLFERFASRLGDALRQKPLLDTSDSANLAAIAKRPVLAAFHPEMPGDSKSAHRLIGLLRHAPDPFVQLIPEGLHHGGTVMAGFSPPPTQDPAEENFARLKDGAIDRVQDKLAEIHADRDRSYAPFLKQLGLMPEGPRFASGE